MSFVIAAPELMQAAASDLSCSKKPQPKEPRSASYWPTAKFTTGSSSLRRAPSNTGRRSTSNSVPKDALLGSALKRLHQNTSRGNAPCQYPSLAEPCKSGHFLASRWRENGRILARQLPA